MEKTRCVQYRGPVPDELVDRIVMDPRSVPMLEYLDWRSVPADVLFSEFPESEGLVRLLETAGIIVCEDSGYRIAGPFKNNWGFLDDYDLQELLVSEKRDWGDAVREMMCCVAYELAAMRLGMDCGSDLKERVFGGDRKRMEDVAERMMGVLEEELGAGRWMR